MRLPTPEAARERNPSTEAREQVPESIPEGEEEGEEEGEKETAEEETVLETSQQGESGSSGAGNGET